MVLANLLTKQDLGLMQLITIILIGMTMLSDVGIGPSIVQNKREDDRFLNTAWTMQVGRGVLIALGMIALARPAAWFFNEPRLELLLPVAALVSLAQGFVSTRKHSLNRELMLKPLTIVMIAEKIVVVAFAVAIAVYVTQTVWALVFATILGAVFHTVASHTYFPGIRNRFCWDRTAVSELVRFGKWIFISTMLAFASGQIDRLMVGKMISIEELGVYGIAVMMAAVPKTLLGHIGSQVIFPVVSKRQDLPRHELRAKLQKARARVLPAIAVGTALMFVTSDLLIQLLYAQRYHDAGWMLALLTLGVWPTTLFITLGPALRAIGLPRYDASSMRDSAGVVCARRAGVVWQLWHVGFHRCRAGR